MQKEGSVKFISSVELSWFKGLCPVLIFKETSIRKELLLCPTSLHNDFF